MMRGLWLVGAALMMASGAQAGEPSELQCVEAGYTPQQTGEIMGLLPKVDILSGGEDASMNALGMLVGTVAADCAETFEWTDGEFEPAVLHELGRLMQLAIRRHGPLAQADIEKIDTALAKGDRSALWTALEEQVGIGMAGEEESVSPANAMVLGSFMIEVGLGLDETTAEQVGAYLATQAMQRISARQFAAQ